MVCSSIDWHWSDGCGVMGFVLLIGSYFALQEKWLTVEGLTYSFINLWVAILLGISLYFRPNYASIIVEIFWGLISLYGLIKNGYRKYQT